MSYPKALRENVEYRRGLLLKCQADRIFAAGVKEKCKRDINSFLWTFDPRKVDAGESPHIPFITWPYQDVVLQTFKKHVGRRDLGVEKSRDMGLSWLCLTLFLHEWQFWPGRAFMVVSRNERLIDSPGFSDPDTLFWKLDYLLKGQPVFLLPRKWTRNKLHLENDDLQSNIDGASTTADVGRGGRRTAFLLDEYGAFEAGDSQAVNAATVSNTRCRIFNSTYASTQGGFVDQMDRKDTFPEDERGIVKITVHWTEHPEKVEGLYQAGPPTSPPQGNEKGKFRSPWYDSECKRLVVPAKIAMELDIDPGGAAGPFFRKEILDRILMSDVRKPFMRGRLIFAQDDLRNVEFVEEVRGDFLLWFLLDTMGRPSKHEDYVIGCDVSFGTGATNSVLSVAESRTREKVAELATPNLSTDRFAELVAAVGWWFNEALVIWEMNGPGGAFGRHLVENLHYGRVYYRRDEQGIEKKIAKGLIPGFFSSVQNKLTLFSEYQRSLDNGEFVNRSKESVEECRQYVYLATGGIGNARAVATSDPSGARSNHGDRPTADALACKALGQEPRFSVQQEADIDPLLGPANPEPHSWAWRRQQAAEEEKLRQSGVWEDDKASRAGWERNPFQENMGW